VADILYRMTQLVPVSPAVVVAVEHEVRRDWGGGRHYVAKIGECGKQQLAARDRQIRADANRGESDTLLASRYGISIRRIQQILGR
jgi:Mor family transcriptional regulator